MRLARALPVLFGALCVWLAVACGEDEPLLTGYDVPGSGGTVAQAGAAGAAMGGSTASGGGAGTAPDAASGGAGGSVADASADATADAANDALADALADAGDAGKTLMPEFGLVDENATSATYQQTLSPSYFKGQVSAWYFGHAT